MELDRNTFKNLCCHLAGFGGAILTGAFVSNALKGRNKIIRTLGAFASIGLSGPVSDAAMNGMKSFYESVETLFNSIKIEKEEPETKEDEAE